MNVYFLRHGVAVEPGEWKGNDFDRPLTRDGVRRMEREARAIAALSLDCSAIVTSPLVRARQTAQIVAQRLDLSRVTVADERLAGDLNVASVSEIVAEHRDCGAVLLVGHEPTLSQTIGRLIGAARAEMKKGALAGVALSDGLAPRGVLIFLLPAKVLIGYAGANA